MEVGASAHQSATTTQIWPSPGAFRADDLPNEEIPQVGKFTVSGILN